MTSPPDSPAPFDAFYAGAWRRLLHQTLAYGGDLEAATRALEAAFAETWQRWSQVAPEQRENDVRRDAFRRLDGKTGARNGLAAPHGTTVAALASLDPATRRGVVLACISDLDLSQVAAQLGTSEDQTLAQVREGMVAVAGGLGIPPQQVAQRLRDLEQVTAGVRPPDASKVRGQDAGEATTVVPEQHRSSAAPGPRRRRQLLLGGGAVALVLVVLVGLLVRQLTGGDDADEASASLGPQVTTAQLLDQSGLAPLGKPQKWSVLKTSDNTSGSGLTSFCQGQRFADPKGLRAYVRSFQLTAKTPRTATQSVELSRTTKRSASAYSRVLGWYSACSRSDLQLLSTYKVNGLGDQATVLKLRSKGQDLAAYSVGVVRTGHILTWAAITTKSTRGPETNKVVEVLQNALQRACASKAAGTCAPARPTVDQNAPPPSGEQPGMLVAADLPSVPGLSQAWRGTDAAPATDNPAATNCDRTDFGKAGSTQTLGRTFLIPGAQAPTRFGVTEVLGQFPTLAQSKGLFAQVVARMNGCQDDDPGATISATGERTDAKTDSAWHLWRLQSEISDKKKITYWMGVARVGTVVAQVTFVAGDGPQDLDQATFTALLVRARDRLYELSPGQPSTTPAPSTPSTSAKPSTKPSASAGSGSAQ